MVVGHWKRVSLQLDRGVHRAQWLTVEKTVLLNGTADECVAFIVEQRHAKHHIGQAISMCGGLGEVGAHTLASGITRTG